MAIVKELKNNNLNFEINFSIPKKEIGNNFNILSNYSIFPKNSPGIETRVVARGTTKSTLYILIPKELKKILKKNKKLNLVQINKNQILMEIK